LHAVVVWLFLASLVAAAFVVRRVGSTRLIRLTEYAMAWTIAQGLIGYVQYFSGVPVFLVALHVAGSVFVWMATMRLCLELIKPVPEMA
jgi:cytochrome c oxidase assembly protein subunit 15